MFRKIVFFSLRLLAVLLLVSLFAGAVMLVFGAPTNSYNTGYAQGYAAGAAASQEGAPANPAAPALPPGGAPLYPPYYAPFMFGAHYGMPFMPLLVCLGGLLLLPLIFFIFRPPWRYAHGWHGAPPWGAPGSPHASWRGAPPPWGCPPRQAQPGAEATPSEPEPRPE